MALDPSQLIGPVGGLLALAYAAGWVTAEKRTEKRMKAAIAQLKHDCERRDAEKSGQIAALTTQVNTLNDFMRRGMERQMGQMHDSTVRMIDGGQIRPPLREGGE